jgi:hypothetical protein
MAKKPVYLSDAVLTKANPSIYEIKKIHKAGGILLPLDCKKTNVMRPLGRVSNLEEAELLRDCPADLSDLILSAITQAHRDWGHDPEKFRAVIAGIITVDAIVIEAVHDERSGRARNAAKKKRSKANESGETMEDLIKKIARNHPDERPSELWSHLKSLIEEWAGDCTEIAVTPRNPMYQYQTKTGEDDTIKFETFRKKLAKIRKSGI